MGRGFIHGTSSATAVNVVLFGKTEQPNPCPHQASSSGFSIRLLHPCPAFMRCRSRRKWRPSRSQVAAKSQSIQAIKPKQRVYAFQRPSSSNHGALPTMAAALKRRNPAQITDNGHNREIE